MGHSRRRKLLGNKKGFSAVIATIFMVLAVLFLYFNVFMYIQKQDSRLQDAVSQSAQLDADRNMELGHVTFSVISCRQVVGTNQFVISCTIVNNSPIPVQLVRFWAQDYQNPRRTNSLLMSTVLEPGGTKQLPAFTITISDAQQPTRAIYMWFITSRGNQVSAMVNVA